MLGPCAEPGNHLVILASHCIAGDSNVNDNWNIKLLHWVPVRIMSIKLFNLREEEGFSSEWTSQSQRGKTSPLRNPNPFSHVAR